MPSPLDSPNSSLPKISGYIVVEELYFGSQTAVYQAIQTAGNCPVIIKVLQNEHPSFSELVQFRNQYTIAKNLSIPGIIHPLSLESVGNGYALVMEDWGGIALDKYLQTQTLEMAEVLAIARQIADILHDLAQHRVIHKDIKPANILIHPESKQIKLIDFSIASLLPRETQEIQNPNALEGTLAYLAPEQTGRMNRGIDYRTDFYSLGVTLYQLLTGHLPFTSDDPLELIYCHLAQLPSSVAQINPKIPGMVAEIVAKLMAKNAEERYQSALGLKHDLEQCLTQWQTTGSIVEFELGQKDVGDRFLIPEKLYGRETEVQTLLKAFERVTTGTSEMMLVAGFSGIGKTVVVHEVHKPIARQHGYFIKGKFDQFNRNIPFSAFVQACRSLMKQLLSESDIQLQLWKTELLAALGDSGKVIIDVIPELERIIGSQPPATELTGIAAQNRFNLLFQKFIQVFTTPKHPLVIFLDDLQWADSASLNLIQLLMAESETGYLLLIGAYRDNEVFPAHPLMLTLDTVSKAGVALNTITLQPLNSDSLNQLVAETLHCPQEVAQPLSELVMQKTQGNPFFATQFLKALHQEELITFDGNGGYWQCDLIRVQDAALTDNMVEFVARMLQKLPTATQEVLKLAACIGNQFDLETLAIVRESSLEEVASDIWGALQAGIILPSSQAYKFFQGEIDSSPIQVEKVSYRFLHDRVQQATYSLIRADQKQYTHLKIGQRLLENTPEEALNEKIFEIVSQLNIGRELGDEAFDCTKLARLNLIAAKQAKATTAYQAAVEYLAVARNATPTSSWDSCYSFTLELYQESAEAAYLSANFEEMEEFITIVRNRACTFLDTVPVYEVKLQAGMAQNKLTEAIQTGRDVLRSLEIVFPETPNPSDIEAAMSAIFSQIASRNPASLVELPLMSDPAKLASIRILQGIAPCAYQAMPTLLPLVVIKQVELSIEFGNSPLSPLGYAFFGLILCGVVGNLETGHQFGQLALALLDRLEAQEIQAATLFVVNADIKPYREAVKNTLQPLQSAYILGLETGDFEFAALSTYIYVYHGYLIGRQLADLNQELGNYNQTLSNLKQKNSLYFNQILRQAVLNLMGLNDEPCQLHGSVYNALEMLPLHQKANDVTAIYYIYFNQMILCYLLGEFEDAVENAGTAENYLHGVTANLVVPIFYFYDSLIRLAYSTIAVDSKPEAWLEKVRSNQEKMHNWANSAPMNFQHKYDLVEAERYRVLENRAKAIDYYDRAIAGAKENEYIQEEALGNELAAKFYLAWGKEKVAAGYMQEAYYCYARWGAKAKVQDLEHRYPQLLAPILQQRLIDLSVTETLSLTLSQATDTDIQSSTLSRANIANALDLASILKASQTLSSEIQLDKLLATLLQTVMENAGADTGALLMPRNETWFVEAIATPEHIQRLNDPLENNLQVPTKLIQYVKNTREPVIINNGKTELPVIGNYWRQHQPKSAMGLPIISQAKLIGILYLENRAISNVFTGDRRLILNFLCTQAAISLENARLYQTSSQYTQQLEESIGQLQQSNLRFQDIFQNSTDAISLFDDQGFIDCNQAMMDLLGYTEAEELCKLHPAQISPEFQADGQSSLDGANAMLAIARSKGHHHFEWQHQRKNGEVFWTDMSLIIIPYNGEQIMYCVMRDISDRKAAEASIKEANVFLNSVLESIPGVFFAKNLQGQHIALNSNLANFFGKSIAEILGKTDAELFPLTIAERIRQKDLEIMNNGITQQFEETMPVNGQDVIYLTVKVPLRNAQGDIVGLVGTAQDINDRKAAEVALAKSEQRFRDVTEAAGEYIWEVDAQTVYTYVTDKSTQVKGYSPAQLLGRSPMELMHPEDLEPTMAILTEASASKSSFVLQHRTILPTGEIVWEEISGLPLLNQAGEIIGYRGTGLSITERKNAEQALRRSLQEQQQSQQLLRNIIDNIPQLVFWKDCDSTFFGCNARAAEVLELESPEQIIGKTDYDFSFTPEEIAEYRACDRRIMESGQAELHIIETQQRSDGSQAWLDTSKVPLYSADGNVIGLLVTITDITQRKTTAAALSESEQRFRDVTEAAGEYIWEVDAQAIYTYVTDKSTQVKGYSPAQLLGRSPMELMHPEDLEPTIAILTEASKKKSSFILQHRTILPTGEVVWEEISGLPLLNQAGEIIGFRGTGLSITERKNAEQALRRSLEESQQTSQDLAEAVALSNGQQEILALIAQGLPLEKILTETALYIESQTDHPAYCSFLEIDAESRLRNLAAPSLSDEYIALVDGASIGPEVGSCGTAAYFKASVTVNNIETDPLWKDYYPAALKYGLQACASTPILGADGKVLATLAMYQPEPGEFTLHDRKLMEVATYLARIAIERHQADIELQQLNLKIIQGEKMASLGNLVAGVAHEINNPLGFLNGSIRNAQDYAQDLMEFIDLYQEQYPQTNELIQEKAEDIDLEFLYEDLPKLLGSMQSATNRIRSISNSLRTFSRADTEFKVSANLHEGIDSTLLILKYRLKANDHRPAIKVLKNYGEVSMIDCFPSQLNQVFMNLLANAIDMFDEAAQQSTYPELEAQPQTIFVETAVLSEANTVTICIKDNGKGMSAEVRERIFDPLFTTKGVGKGTGLGLAIAQQIVKEKHGGRLEVQSELGRGTEFTIHLPVNPT